MILRPGLHTIVGHDLELFFAVVTQWCVASNQYACYVNIETHGPPILCRPVDEMALTMLNHVHLLPNDVFAGRLGGRRQRLELVR